MENVIVIGAGPAGLTAAYELLKKAPDKYSVTILEESDEIGGISKTVKYHGNRMDIGGHRFFSKDAEVTKWWEEIMPNWIPGGSLWIRPAIWFSPLQP